MMNMAKMIAISATTAASATPTMRPVDGLSSSLGLGLPRGDIEGVGVETGVLTTIPNDGGENTQAVASKGRGEEVISTMCC